MATKAALPSPTAAAPCLPASLPPYLPTSSSPQVATMLFCLRVVPQLTARTSTAAPLWSTPTCLPACLPDTTSPAPTNKRCSHTHKGAHTNAQKGAHTQQPTAHDRRGGAPTPPRRPKKKTRSLCLRQRETSTWDGRRVGPLCLVASKS